MTAQPPEGIVPYDPFDYRIHEDPFPTYRWMRDHAPVYRNDSRDFWALSRHQDVRDALKSHQLYSSSYGISLEPELWSANARQTSFFLAMDPPESSAYRNLVHGAFTLKRVTVMEPRIRELTRMRLEPLLQSDTFDFAADYAAAVPNDVLCEQLGIPEEDWDLVRSEIEQMNHRADGSDDRGPNAVAAAYRLGDYLAAFVRSQRRRPADNLTSTMLRADLDGERLTDGQVIGFLFVMIGAGNESTGKTIGHAWYHGWRMPEVQALGLEHRAADWADETLRYDSASQMVARLLTQDTTLHGVSLPAGARIALLPACANRDERAFDDPERFDLDRDTRKMISYGHGPHHCLGAILASLQMRIILEEIGARVESYDIDMSRARRVHSPHQRGFASLPTTVVFRKKPLTVGC